MSPVKTGSIRYHLLNSRIVLTFLGFAVAGIPTWLFLIMHHLFEPQGFWQNVFFVGFGFYFLGAAQIFLLGVLLVWLYFVLNN